MHSLLADYSVLNPVMAYFLIFLGITIEGDIVLFTSAFLASQGLLDPFIILVITLFGVFVRDLSWYEIGKKFDSSNSKMAAYAKKIADPFDNHLTDQLFRSVFIAKFVYGLHLAIIMRIGALNIEPKKFIKADALATLIWIFIVGGLGYLSSESLAFFEVEKYLKYTEIALAGGITTYVVLHMLVAHYSKKTLRQE